MIFLLSQEGSRIGLQRQYDGSLHVFVDSKYKGAVASDIPQVRFQKVIINKAYFLPGKSKTNFKQLTRACYLVRECLYVLRVSSELLMSMEAQRLFQL